MRAALTVAVFSTVAFGVWFGILSLVWVIIGWLLLALSYWNLYRFPAYARSSAPFCMAWAGICLGGFCGLLAYFSSSQSLEEFSARSSLITTLTMAIIFGGCASALGVRLRERYHRLLKERGDSQLVRELQQHSAIQQARISRFLGWMILAFTPFFGARFLGHGIKLGAFGVVLAVCFTGLLASPGILLLQWARQTRENLLKK